jgi:hypothetical protein
MNTVGNGQPGAPGAGAADQAQAAARDTAHKAAEEGSALVGTAADQAKDLTHQARQQLGTVTDEARDQARRALSTTSDELTGQIEDRLGDATEMAQRSWLRASPRRGRAGSTRTSLKASDRLSRWPIGWMTRACAAWSRGLGVRPPATVALPRRAAAPASRGPLARACERGAPPRDGLVAFDGHRADHPAGHPASARGHGAGPHRGHRTAGTRPHVHRRARPRACR